MKILIADDSRLICQFLQTTLKEWGHEVIVSENGSKALKVLEDENTPSMAILDWIMPDLDGIEICRKMRGPSSRTLPLYIILLSSKDSKKDIINGIEAGADDYITKPFEPDELRVRVNAGERVLKLQFNLKDRIKKLEMALEHVKQLQRLLPICAYCKKIRDEKNYWHQVENYISEHTDTKFSHGFCPDCYEKHIKPQLETLPKK